MSKKTKKSQFTKPAGETEEPFSFPKEPAAKPLREMVMDRLKETGQVTKWQAKGNARAQPPPKYVSAGAATLPSMGTSNFILDDAGVELRNFSEEEAGEIGAWRVRCDTLEAQNAELRKKITALDSESAFCVQHEQGGDDVKFHYSAIADLPKKFKVALRRLDTDGDGEISLAEM